MAHTADTGVFKPFDAKKYRIGIVVAQFNATYTETMLREALKICKEYKIVEKNITILRVPGSVEIPITLQALAKTKKYSCLIALGAIIKGETAHFDYVAQMVSDGVLRVQLDYNVPIGFGIITAFTKDQAAKRISFGKDAAIAALQTKKAVDSI